MFLIVFIVTWQFSQHVELLEWAGGQRNLCKSQSNNPDWLSARQLGHVEEKNPILGLELKVKTHDFSRPFRLLGSRNETVTIMQVSGAVFSLSL